MELLVFQLTSYLPNCHLWHLFQLEYSYLLIVVHQMMNKLINKLTLTHLYTSP